MKITQVISDSNIGGAGVLLSSITSALKDDFDFEVIIPRNSKLKERLEDCGIKVTELDMCADKSFSPKDIKVFYKHFKNNPAHIVHTHASLSARLAGKIAGTEFCISTRHCAKPAQKAKKKPYLQRMIYNYCTDLTISTAEFATDNLICEGVDSSKIKTIKNGSVAPKRNSKKENSALRKALGIKDGCRILGSCARLEAVKGQDIILRAAPYILKKFPDVYFLFIGEGSKREEYERVSAALGINERVIFHGFAKHPEEYQNLFYINLNASRGTETSCLATSETMALGIPTLASDFGGNKEMIRDGENGLLFECDNVFSFERAVEKILSDEKLYQKLSCGAEESYKNDFSISRMSEEYKALYSELMPKSRQKHRLFSKKIDKSF